MVADGLSIPREREPPAAEARGAALARAPLGGQREQPRSEPESLGKRPVAVDQEVVRERKDAVDVALDVDVLVEVRLGHGQLAGRPQQRAHRASMVEHQGEAGLGRLRRPHRAVPEPDVEVARVVLGEEVTQHAQPGRRRVTARSHGRRRSSVATSGIPILPGQRQPAATAFGLASNDCQTFSRSVANP